MMEDEKKLYDLISEKHFKEADQMLQEYLDHNGLYDDILAICDGSIGENLGDRERTWAAICQGLCFNPENDKLYVMLGNYYLNRNKEQSWLCYEHALANCKDEAYRKKIQDKLQKLTENSNVLVGRVSVVIWCHGGLHIIKPCVESVVRALAGCSGQIIAVAAQWEKDALKWLKQQREVILVEMDADWEMSQSWEKGISAAWTDADFLLMDSGTILTEHTLFWLRMALYSSKETGTAGSMSSRITNSRLADLVKAAAMPDSLSQLARQLNVPMRFPCEVLPWTKGSAVMIKRQALIQAGIPHKNFVNGVFMDREYGEKIKATGYRNLLCENSFLLYQEEEAPNLHPTDKNQPGHDKTFRPKIKRFLLFYAGNEQGYYQDTKHFTEEISHELRRRGHQTFICDLTGKSHDSASLNAYLASGVDVVLTFNGEAILEKSLWQFWNRLEALVVNILMDPPFHIDLFQYLENPNIEQYLLLCPDEHHVEYVKHYFPQVKHVEFMPHGGTPMTRKPIPWKKKELNLLFCGSYIQPEKFLNAMKQNMTPEEFRIYTEMGERLLQDSRLSVEQVVEETRLSDPSPLTPSKIDAEISGMNLLEGWVRMEARKRVVTALVEGGVDLCVLGGGWQDCSCAKNKRFHRLSQEMIPLPDTLTWMEKAKINLNVMPWFKAGSHDRVFNAMLRESVALTDPSSYFQKYFRGGESIVYYFQDDLERLPEIVHGLLTHPDRAERIVKNGYEKAAAFTWRNYVEELMTKIEKCLR